MINLRSLNNARDFSGIINMDGMRIRGKRFIRSNALGALSERDGRYLSDSLRVRTVIDLRTEKERTEKPDKVIPGADYVHVPLLNDSVVGITHEQRTEQSRFIPEMAPMYRNIVSNAFTVDGIAQVLNILCDPPDDGAILWHCSEGKDRCGIVSALFLSLLNVDREAIFQDYLLTNRVAEKKAKKLYHRVLLFKRDKEMAEKVYRVYLADSAYLLGAFDQIEKDWGSVDAFAEKRLGIDAAKRRRLSEAALETAD